MIMITGGVKSGKSSFALDLARKYEKKAFLATGVPFDEEMKTRIERHKKERGNDFDTFEEPLEVPKLLSDISYRYDVIVFDCLTTYLGNLYHYNVDVENYLEKLLRVFSHLKTQVIVITNEVGWGIIPENKLARDYAEILGKANTQIAKISQEVYLMVSGIGVRIK
ncbi:MAG: bifunctional adenosylcobinamide kinase/adenosylcobinamide-phosphate guanylyltransferase [Fervidobacterium sp.]|nr:bifunctional adenosylcobinamide kinase/adenosylcobinamide-phosphate guanylyltransferase [Fervidobacterium sp.]